MKKNLLALLVLSLFPIVSIGQSLEQFIEMGLSDNRQLRATESNYQVTLQAVDEARRMGSLKLDFISTYTLAAGGRTIDVPVGDLLNPVYNSLNALTGSDQFPQVENASELLNPNNFYDVKVRAAYPIINRAIGLNMDIKRSEARIANLEVDRNKQQLVSDISRAYYDLLKARNAVNIYNEISTLIAESQRVVNGLHGQGKVLKVDVLSTQNDSIQVWKDIANAQLNASQAQAFLNMKVDRPLDSEVSIIESINTLPRTPLVSQGNQRPELAQLDELSELNSKVQSLVRANAGPQLNAFVDIGLQDFDFNVDRQSPYVLAGISFNLNLYDGGMTKAKTKLAAEKIHQIAEQKAAIEQQIKLEAYNQKQTITATTNEYNALQEEIKIRQRQYNDQIKRYKVGTINYIDVQDARNDLIQAQLKSNNVRYEIWNQVAEYKRILSIQ